MAFRIEIAPRAFNDLDEIADYIRRNRKYKVYFSIERRGRSAGKVCILHVRHWARKRLTTDEVQALMDEVPAKVEPNGDE